MWFNTSVFNFDIRTHITHTYSICFKTQLPFMVYKNLCIYCICRNEHTFKVNIFLLRKTSSIVVTIENIVNQAVTLTKFDYFYGHVVL